MRPIDETRALMSGRESEVLVALGITLPKKGKMRCPTPSHEDRDPSWRWDDRAARWHCTCGHGDAIDLVQSMGMAHDAMSACHWIRETLGLPPITQRRRRETPAQRAERERKAAAAAMLAEQRQAGRAAEDERDTRLQLLRVRMDWLASIRITGTPAETYMRRRGITCSLPMTLRALPPSGRTPGRMIAPFALASEPEPGVLAVSWLDVRGLHVTGVADDGGPATLPLIDRPRKATLGRGHDLPIVLAPPGDSLALCIAEGIEDALSVHQATGMGAWAAGTANRLPGLARHVPAWIEAVTIIIDNDKAGRTCAPRLADALAARRIDVSTLTIGEQRHAA